MTLSNDPNLNSEDGKKAVYRDGCSSFRPETAAAACVDVSLALWQQLLCISILCIMPI